MRSLRHASAYISGFLKYNTFKKAYTYVITVNSNKSHQPHTSAWYVYGLPAAFYFYLVLFIPHLFTFGRLNRWDEHISRFKQVLWHRTWVPDNTDSGRHKHLAPIVFKCVVPLWTLFSWIAFLGRFWKEKILIFKLFIYSSSSIYYFNIFFIIETIYLP